VLRVSGVLRPRSQVLKKSSPTGALGIKYIYLIPKTIYKPSPT